MQLRLFNNIIKRGKSKALCFCLLYMLFLPVVALGNEGDDPADRLFHFANGLYKRELYKLAISQYQKFLSQYPGNPNAGEAVFLLGESYFKLENFTEANDAFNRYVSGYSDGKMAGMAYFRTGYFEFSKSNYSAAIESLSKASALGGHEGAILVQVNYYLGKSYLEVGNLEEAIKYLKEVAGEGAAQLRPHALFAMATAFEKTNDSINALENFNELISEFPNHELIPVTLLRAAELFFSLERYEDAASRLNELLALQYDELIEVAQHRLIWCYYILKDTDQLSPLVDGFLARFPDSKYKGEAVFLKAEVAYEKGDDDVALKGYLEAAEGCETGDFVAQSYYKLGLIYEKSKEYQKAVEALNTLASNYPSHTLSGAAIIQAAQICEKELGDPSEALTRYQTYLTLSASGRCPPNDQYTELATFRIATCQFTMKKYDEMAGSFEQFITNFPASPYAAEAMYYVGWNHERKKDYEKAIPYYERMLEAEAGLPHLYTLKDDTRFRLALCYYNIKRYPEAAEAFYKIFSQTASLSEERIPEEVVLWLGEYFANDGSYGKAVTIYKGLLNENPVSKWAERCLYRLGEWHGKMGEWRESILRYERMLNDFPNSELVLFARLGIAEAHENLKEFPESRMLYENLAKGGAMLVSARANLGLGNIFRAEGDYEKAILSYMYVAILFDDAEVCSKALLGASQCWLAMGDTRQSDAALKELLNRYPDGPYSSEAKKKLQASQ